MAQQYQNKVIDAATASANSSVIDASNIYSISAQVVGTGTLTGTIKLQASNDTPIGSPGANGLAWAPSNWTDIASATATFTAASNALIPKTDVCYQFVRVVFTASGGTGTATVNVKVLSV